MASFSLNKSAFLGSSLKSSTLLPNRIGPASLTVVAGWGRLVKIGPGKKWEHRELTTNDKPVIYKLHVRKGDLVQVIAGKDKGKTGLISKVLPKDGKVVVEGVNIRTRHIKPRSANETGQIKQSEGAIDSSNVMLYSKEKGVRSRVGHKFINGNKVRYLIKTGEIIDSVLA